MIAIDVVKLAHVSRNIYHNDGTVKVLVNPAFIAEIWPAETVDISRRAANVAERTRVIGTVRVAKLYTLNEHDSMHFRYITPESYQKLVEKLGETSAEA